MGSPPAWSVSGIGPGDEVLVPAHTYMATATAVLAVGAIPVIVDIDESITISPDAIRDAIGPHTRAIIPVHMWGAACNMDAIMDIAEQRGLLVLEDVCQGIGGAYEGRKLGSIGHAGAVQLQLLQEHDLAARAAASPPAIRRWPNARAATSTLAISTGRAATTATKPFAGVGARASELLGAMLNVQLDRLDGMIESDARREEDGSWPARNISTISACRASPMNSADHDCATQVMFTLPNERGRVGLRQDDAERHRRQDRPAHLHAMGPGADA